MQARNRTSPHRSLRWPMHAERFEADYLVETSLDLDAAVEAMAGEQSSGTFVPVPGETPELKSRAAAQVVACHIIGEVGAPSLPGAKRRDGPIIQAKVTLSWPLS